LDSGHQGDQTRRLIINTGLGPGAERSTRKSIA
jgi:hypothetical protein